MLSSSDAHGTRWWRIQKFWAPSLLCLIGLFIYTNVAAQISVVVSGSSSSSLPNLMIHVLDSASKANLPGANIKVVLGKDTTHLSADSQGNASFPVAFRADSAAITISHLGYKTKTVVAFPPERGTRYVHVFLAEQPHELAEIVVVGEAVAVVIKGDTVQFNANAFKTFEGDAMTKLFEVLPGMKLENNMLTYLGKKIDRVTIDGNRLFGDNVMLAMENIKADDVVDVSVYKEASDWDKLNKVKNPELKTVANVRTKSKPSMIRNTTLAAGAGATLDQDYRENRRALYDVSGGLVYSRVGETVSTGADRNNVMYRSGSGGAASFVSTDGSGLSLKPESETTNGSFYYDRQEVNKFGFQTNNSANFHENSDENWNNREYFPSEYYSQRNYHEQNLSNAKRKSFNSQNTLSRTFKDKSIFRSKLNYSFNDNTSESTGILSAMRDGNLTQSQQIRQRDATNSRTLSAEIGGHKKFNSIVSLNLSAAANISDNDGSGWRIDTLASSTSHVDLENESGGWNRNYSLSASANFKLAPTMTWDVSDKLSHIDSKSRRASVDMLTGITDLTNSYDYRIHELSNFARSTLTYRDNNKKIGVDNVTVDVGWERKIMQRDAFFPKAYELPRSFNLIQSRASVNYKLSAFTGLIFNFARSPVLMPSLLDYMELDDSNPLMLRAGNPLLKPEVENSFSTTSTFMKGASTYEFGVQYSTVENSIVDKYRYFQVATYLPEYDYTAMAGSSLLTRENHNGEKGLRVSGNYSVRSRKLQSNIQTGLIYRYSSTPGYVNEQLVAIVGNQFNASLQVRGNFSSTFMPSLSSVTQYTTRDNSFVRNRWLSQKLGMDVRLRITRSIELNNSNNFRWNIQWPDVPGMDRFGIVSNISVDYFLGKKRNFTLKAEVNDLFNRQQRIGVITDPEYIATTYTAKISRFIMIRAEWKF
ncbi:MAG: hypothetical protein LBR67_03890 [Dysgonamonadaceae bacterium]|jgi:hypothetical protein|nr:hypothetical protein [Dysgonamonadaceae bacterium]